MQLTHEMESHKSNKSIVMYRYILRYPDKQESCGLRLSFVRTGGIQYVKHLTAILANRHFTEICAFCEEAYIEVYTAFKHISCCP